MNLFHAYQKRMRWVPPLVEVGLVVCAAWLIVSAWLPVEVYPETNDLGYKAFSDAGFERSSSTIALGLFGEIAMPAVAEPKALQQAMDSKLNIEVVGTMASSSHPAALLHVSGRTDVELFYIGDAVMPGVILHAVENNKVVLDVHGRLEVLWLSKEDSSGMMSPQTGGTSDLQNLASDVRTIQVQRTVIHEALQSFPKLMSEVNITPYFRDGSAEGFMVASIQDGSLIQRLGVMAGDVLLKVNNSEVKTMDQALMLYRNLQDAGSLDVVLMRNGQEKRLHYEIE